MSAPTTSPEALAQQVSTTERQAAEARTALEQHQAAAMTAREARLDEFDRQVAETWESQETVLREAENAAWQTFMKAVMEEPAYAAWIEYLAKRTERQALRSEAEAAITRLGLTEQLRIPAQLGYYQGQLAQDILTIAQKAAADVAGQRIQDRYEAREAAGDGNSRESGR